MKPMVVVVMVLGALGGPVSARSPEFTAGRAAFAEGEFRQAAAHFERALKADPNDAAAYYWSGMAYERMADVATPFGGRYSSKAREYLTKAMTLAPDRADYRRELFDLLLDSATDSSRRDLRRATAIVMEMSESDPDYSVMQRRLMEARNKGFSAGALLSDAFLAGPRAFCRIAAVPASVLSNVRFTPAEE